MLKLSVMSARYGIPVAKLRKLEKHGLEYEDDNLHGDALHDRAMYDASRNRVTAFTIAYLALSWENDGEEWQARAASIKESYKDGGAELQEIFDRVQGEYSFREKMVGAQAVVDRICEAPGNAPDHEAMRSLASWVKHIVDIYNETEIDHIFLAARLLASMPLLEMPKYPKLIATAVARARWHKHLEGYWRLDGKRIIYEKPLDL